MKTFGKILLRLTTLPFYSVIVITRLVVIFFIHLYNFLVYGGEMITYNSKVNSHTILDVYNKMNERL